MITDGMKKYWLTWTVKGRKHAIECWHYSIQEAEAGVLKRATIYLLNLNLLPNYQSIK